MKKKSIWITLSVIIVIIAATVGTIFYRRDSNGKPFKASLNHEKVMMIPDWNAMVKLKANKGATYRVLNSDKKVVQGTHKTTNGKANIKLAKTGDYTVVAKSDNGHVSKKLPVKVTHYKANINKWTNAVGPLKFKVDSVDYKKVAKSKKNNTDFSDDIFDSLNKKYYQVVVTYEVKNSGSKAVNPQYTQWLPVDDSGREFPWETGSAEAVQNDNITGTSAIQAHSSRVGKMTMISNQKFSVKHFQFNVAEVLGNNGNHIAKGGIAKVK